MSVRYLIVVNAPMRRLTRTTFAMESAFAEHVRAMAKELAPRFTEIVLACPEYSSAEYEVVRESLAVVDESREPIRFERVWSTDDHHTSAFMGLARLRALVAECDLVHTHVACNPRRPQEAVAGAIGVALNKPVVVVADMDHRGETARDFAEGRIGVAGYVSRLLSYDAIWESQQRAWVHLADLLLFKEQQQVEAYGRGAPHVRLFRDPNYSADQVIAAPQLKKKLERLRDVGAPLRLVYFGRLVPYKGVDHMITAVAEARQAGANLRLDIIGVGPERAALEAQVAQLGIGDLVQWVHPRPYADGFLDLVRNYDALLACPLAADTPRSTWDAISSGLAVVAYDTPFYRSVAEQTGVVDTTPDRDPRALAAHLVGLAADKTALVPRIRHGVAVARENTQEAWLRRRADWIEEVFEARAARAQLARADEASALRALLGVRARRGNMRPVTQARPQLVTSSSPYPAASPAHDPEREPEEPVVARVAPLRSLS